MQTKIISSTCSYDEPRSKDGELQEFQVTHPSRCNSITCSTQIPQGLAGQMRGGVLSLLVGETLDKILKTNLISTQGSVPRLYGSQASQTPSPTWRARRHQTRLDSKLTYLDSNKIRDQSRKTCLEANYLKRKTNCYVNSIRI